MHFQKESRFHLLPTINVLPLGSQSLELFQPLATQSEPWQAIPGVSEWVMTMIRWGYTLQFAWRPPRFRGMLATTVRSEDAQVLRAEVMNLLEKAAIEIIPPAQSESGFYSRYCTFLGSLWQSSSRPLRLRRQLSLPNLFHKEHRCPGPWVAQSSALCFPSNRSATAGTQMSQGAMAQAYSNSPPLEEPAVGVRVIPAAWSSPVANPFWYRTSSLKQTARYGIHGPSYGPCMCGRSIGDFWPPRACPEHDGRS